MLFRCFRDNAIISHGECIRASYKQQEHYVESLDRFPEAEVSFAVQGNNTSLLFSRPLKGVATAGALARI